MKTFTPLIIIFVFAACSGSTSSQSKTTEADNQTSEPISDEVSRSPLANIGNKTLDPKWYLDADNNAIPDFIEQQVGKDPANDDCGYDLKDCGNGAQGSDIDVNVYTLIMLDASGSMVEKMGSDTKLNIAKASLLNFARLVPDAIQLGFMVYGHKGNNKTDGKAESCAGVEVLAPIGSVKPETFPSVLQRFTPTGWTPIAASLAVAKDQFKNLTGKSNRIVMVSDGLETCGGDPIAMAGELKRSGLNVVVDVVGFGVSSADAQQLRKIADAGGGTYFDARTGADLDLFFANQTKAYQKNMGDAFCVAEKITKTKGCDADLVAAALTQINKEQNTLSRDVAKRNAVEAVKRTVLSAARKRREQFDNDFNRFKQLASEGQRILDKNKEVNERAKERRRFQ